MILKDSLGGNCKTRMISTASAMKDDIDETICTLNFSQRVAMIKNQVLKNEVVDPNIIISRLKVENAELKAEIEMLKGGKQKEFLTEEDRLSL